MPAPLQPHHYIEKVRPESPPGVMCSLLVQFLDTLEVFLSQHNSLWKLWDVWEVRWLEGGMADGKLLLGEICVRKEFIKKQGSGILSALRNPLVSSRSLSSGFWWWPFHCLICHLAMLCSSLSVTRSPPFSASWNAVFCLLPQPFLLGMLSSPTHP